MIRITAGELKGRSIDSPQTLKTRPSQGKLRQALFNSIQFSVPEARVLDLYAGAGTLSFEALSRQAAFVLAIELEPKICELIRKNAQKLKVEDRIAIWQSAVEKKLVDLCHYTEKNGLFDIVLADPPYALGAELDLLNTLPWQQILTPDGSFYLEWGKLKSQVKELPEETELLVKVREKIYSESVLSTYRLKTP